MNSTAWQGAAIVGVVLLAVFLLASKTTRFLIITVGLIAAIIALWPGVA